MSKGKNEYVLVINLGTAGPKVGLVDKEGRVAACTSASVPIYFLPGDGATHEMVTGEPEGRYMRIYTLNTKKSPPPIPDKIEEMDITRHFFATTGSNDRLPDGSYAVYGFPQFENCIVPLVSRDDTDLIALDRIQVVTNIMRPYNT